MKKLKKVLQSNYTYILLIPILILYSLLLNSNYTKSKYLLNETSIYGYINSYYIDGDKLNIILIGKEKIICNYYFKSLNDKNKFIETYQLGDNINLYGEMSVPTNNTIPNLFNYRKYLKYEKMNYIFNISEIKLESKNEKLFYKLKNYIFHKVRNKVDSSYLYTFILGNSKYIDNQVMDSYRVNGVSHLFAVSGMHVSLISLILMKLLGKFKHKDIVVIVFILLYMFLTNFSPSILRAGLLFILIEINKILKFNLNTKKIIILLLVILLIIDPYIIYKIGFQYSYVISFYLIYFNKLIVKQKNKVGKLFMVSFISFLASLPITINNFFQINLLSIIINVFMVPIISIIIFPLSILSLIVPFLDKIVLFIITIFEDISLFLSKIDWFILTMKKVDFIVLILYYLTITLVLYFGMKGSFKWIYILAIFLFIHHNINYFNNNTEITYIDVGQGDSILINYSNNKGVVLIDTGGIEKFNNEKWREKNNTFSIGEDSVCNYLKSEGIRTIDYLILTHGDFDHMGEAKSLLDCINIKKVIFNNGYYNDLELKLIEELDKDKIEYYQNMEKISIGANKLYFLNSGEYNNENDNSNVIYTEINNNKFLFMGDAGIDKEHEIIKDYDLNNITFFKVGHHGSNTSSSKKFIDKINPKYSIISVGKDNRYGHPKEEILKTLINTNIYRTDKQGSIKIMIRDNKYNIYTFPP